MDSDRWERIQALFQEASALPQIQQQSFLEAACGEDADLLLEVLGMLEADSRSASLLDRGLPDVAYQMIGAAGDPVSSREFGPYRLIRILGEGGMGVVWLAERKDAGNLVAIKFLPHGGLSPARRERFAREIKTLGKLRHPFIARFYDAGALTDGTPWFVMEYVNGVRLMEYCSKRERPVEEQLRLFRMVCEAVQYAHGQEIIHRDLKPSNILVEQDGTPRLLDFGIAREFHSSGEGEEQTRLGLRMMTPKYAAPEWSRDGTVGFFTDVYSLGVILREMLEASAAGKSDLDVLCRKAVHEDVEQRYRSVEALLRDIDHYLKGEPLEARPDTFGYRLGKFVTRHRRAVVGTAAAFLLAVGLMVLFTVRLAKARNTALAEAVRTKRVERFMLNLFEGGDNEAAPSGGLRVVTLLDRGAKQAASLNSDPETQAELYETLGTMYEMLGDFPKADKLLHSGLDTMKAAAGAEDAKVARALSQLGTLRGDQAQYKEAEKLTTEAATLAGRHLPADDPAVLAAKTAVGRVLAQSGAYDRAIAELEPVTRIAPAGEEGAYTLRESLTALGVAQYAAGHYEAAESLDQRALALDRQLFGKSHPQTGVDLMNLATVKMTEAEYPEAERLYREAIDIVRGWYGPNHPDIATCMSVLARTLVAEGKYAEAESFLEQALKIQERAYGAVHDRVAFTLQTLGRIALKQGDLARAQAQLSRAVEIYRASVGERNRLTAVASVDLADVYMRQGQYSHAEPILGGAVGVLTTTLPVGDAHIGTAQISWGRALFGQKRYNDAEKQLLAGYRNLEQQHVPPAAQMQEARKNLADVYEALHDAEKANKFRAEMAAADLTMAAGNSKGK